MVTQGISVVIPCYNAQRYVRQAIESALAQDVGCQIEILVCDDGSKDESRSVISSMEGPITLFRHPGGANRGISASRNLCIENARYPFIAFLDADDEWLPNHLSALLQCFKEDSSLGMAVNNGIRKSGNKVGGTLVNWPDPKPLDAEEVLLNSWFPPAGVMLRRNFLLEVDTSNADRLMAEDYDLWLRFLERFPGRYTGQTGYYYRYHSGQCSLKRELWEDTEKILLQAAARGFYSKRAVRKRKAVINYRYAQHSIREGRRLRAARELFLAFCYDPPRAVGQLFRIATGTPKSI